MLGMSSNTTYVLYERGTSALASTYEDDAGRPAFTVSSYREPNTLVRIAREKEWALQHASDIKGSGAAFVYLDYADRPVHVAFGAGERRPIAEWLRKNKKDDALRMWTSQSIGQTGGEYKWRVVVSGEKLECLKGNTVIATWERTSAADGFDAKLTLKYPALPIVTEVLATLTLNRMRLQLSWN